MKSRRMMAAALAGAVVALVGAAVVPGTMPQAMAQGAAFTVPSQMGFPLYDQLDADNPNVYPDPYWANVEYAGVPRRKETCLAVVLLMIEHARGNTTFRINTQIKWSDAVGVSESIPGVAGGEPSNIRFDGTDIVNRLKGGNPVILQTNDLDPQHFILAIGIDARGMIIAHDPLGGHRVTVNQRTGRVTGGQSSYTIHNYRTVNFALGAAPPSKSKPRPTPKPTPTPPPVPLPPPLTSTLRVPVPPVLQRPGASARARAPVMAGRVQLRWSASTGATGYEVEVRDARTGASLFGQSTTATRALVNLPAGRMVQWTARACSRSGCSGNSAPLFFNTEAATPAPTPTPTPRPTPSPTPTPPPNPRPGPPPVLAVPGVPKAVGPGATREPGPVQSETRVTVEWTSVTGAGEYDLRVRDLATGQFVFNNRIRGTGQRLTLQAGSRYRWDVAACNAAGCSRYTVPLHFTVAPAGGGSGSGGGGTPSRAVPDVPRNLSPGRSREPGQRLSIASATLQWAEVPGATYYELDLRDLTAKRTISVGQLRRRFHILKMTKGSSYRWSVRACNAAGCSASSQRLYFVAP